jgi:hypothetical protein
MLTACSCFCRCKPAFQQGEDIGVFIWLDHIPVRLPSGCSGAPPSFCCRASTRSTATNSLRPSCSRRAPSRSPTRRDAHHSQKVLCAAVLLRTAVLLGRSEALLLISTPVSKAAHLGLHQRVLQLAVDRDRQVGRHGPRRGGPDGDCSAVHVLLQAVWDALTCAKQTRCYTRLAAVLWTVLTGLDGGLRWTLHC